MGASPGDVGEATEGLYNELWRRWNGGRVGESLHLRHSSFSNSSAASPTSQLILQPFRYFTYVTGTSPASPGEPPMVSTRRNRERNIYLLYVGPNEMHSRFCIETYLRHRPNSQKQTTPLSTATNGIRMSDVHCVILIKSLRQFVFEPQSMTNVTQIPLFLNHFTAWSLRITRPSNLT